MTTSHRTSKPTPADLEAMNTLDEALDETFPASDPVAIKPDESEAELKTQRPRSSTRASDAPTSPRRR